MESTYEYYKRRGAKQMDFNSLPKNYAWITGCGGDGWYWNFFYPKDEIGDGNPDDKKVIMCKIKKL
jgi:hypothetical protein